MSFVFINCSPPKLVVDWYAYILYCLYQMGDHGVKLKYDSNSEGGEIAQAQDIPDDVKELLIYAKCFRFNKNRKN